MNYELDEDGTPVLEEEDVNGDQFVLEEDDTWSFPQGGLIVAKTIVP